MKKIVTALLAIFAVAGISNIDAACCGCPAVKSSCPEKKPRCKRESKCPKCSFFVSKCGCKASESKKMNSSDEMSSDENMLDLEDSMEVETEDLDEMDAY